MNPVYDTDFPDPTILRASDSWYYAYATQTVTVDGTTNIQLARSTDLVLWECLPDALPVKPEWASETQDFWVPDVVERDGLYYMYYSAEPDSRDGLCLGVATSTSPVGPFTDSGKPLVCGPGFENIDPMAFDDPLTGKRLLYWGSGFGPIRVQELASDRLSFLPRTQPAGILYPSGRPYESLIEGPFVILRGEWYYLFYSGDNCCGENAHYAVMVARARSATGPFESLAEATGRPNSVILELSDRWDAPGHNSVLTDPNGQDWLVYHAIDANNRYLRTANPHEKAVRRVMCMDRIVYRDGWPTIQASTASSGEEPELVVRGPGCL